MTPTERANCYRGVALIVDIASLVIWTHLRENILFDTSLQSFLNIKKEKHKLIHVFNKQML